MSDWSSDVCSSDLLRSRPHPPSGHLLPCTGEGLPNQSHRAALPTALLLRSGRRWRAAPDEGASAAKHALALALLLLPHPGQPARARAASSRFPHGSRHDAAMARTAATHTLVLPIAPERWRPPAAEIELDGLPLGPTPELPITLVGRVLGAALRERK